MARRIIHEPVSPYYPPRARWYAFAFRLRDSIQRRVSVDRLTAFRGLTLWGLAAGLVVPGLAVYLRGPRWWGWLAMGTSAALLSVYTIWLGYPHANFAMGALISLHCSGLVYYCTPALAGETFRTRIAVTLLFMLTLTLGPYNLARSYIQAHYVTPIRVHDQVLIVRRARTTDQVQRGDWVAYRLNRLNTGDPVGGGAVHVLTGVGLGPVLAVGGDQVEFTANGFLVNGVRHAKLSEMPSDGGVTVPKNHWFIWPDLAISGGHGNVSQAAISATLLQLADVEPGQYLGKPVQHWFWRQQKLP